MTRQGQNEAQTLLAELRPACTLCGQRSFSGRYYWRTLGEGWEGYVCEPCAMKHGKSTS